MWKLISSGIFNTAVGYLCPSNAEHFQPSLNSNFASECTDFHVIRDTLWSSSGGSGPFDGDQLIL
jgi:hypothetical protein